MDDLKHDDRWMGSGATHHSIGVFVEDGESDPERCLHINSGLKDLRDGSRKPAHGTTM